MANKTFSILDLSAETFSNWLGKNSGSDVVNRQDSAVRCEQPCLVPDSAEQNAEETWSKPIEDEEFDDIECPEDTSSESIAESEDSFDVYAFIGIEKPTTSSCTKATAPSQDTDPVILVNSVSSPVSPHKPHELNYTEVLVEREHCSPLHSLIQVPCDVLSDDIMPSCDDQASVIIPSCDDQASVIIPSCDDQASVIISSCDVQASVTFQSCDAQGSDTVSSCDTHVIESLHTSYQSDKEEEKEVASSLKNGVTVIIRADDSEVPGTSDSPSTGEDSLQGKAVLGDTKVQQTDTDSPIDSGCSVHDASKLSGSTSNSSRSSNNSSSSSLNSSSEPTKGAQTRKTKRPVTGGQHGQATGPPVSKGKSMVVKGAATKPASMRTTTSHSVKSATNKLPGTTRKLPSATMKSTSATAKPTSVKPTPTKSSVLSRYQSTQSTVSATSQRSKFILNKKNFADDAKKSTAPGPVKKSTTSAVTQPSATARACPSKLSSPSRSKRNNLFSIPKPRKSIAGPAGPRQGLPAPSKRLTSPARSPTPPNASSHHSTPIPRPRSALETTPRHSPPPLSKHRLSFSSIEDTGSVQKSDGTFTLDKELHKPVSPVRYTSKMKKPTQPPKRRSMLPLPPKQKTATGKPRLKPPQIGRVMPIKPRKPAPKVDDIELMLKCGMLPKVVHSPVDKENMPASPHSEWSPIRRRPVRDEDASIMCTKHIPKH